MWANVTIYHDIQIGENCLIQSSTVIGADGFGYANDRGNWVKIPQLGRVIIGDRVGSALVPPLTVARWMILLLAMA